MSGANPPARIAVVGSGPAGLYAASHLLRQYRVPVEVDVFERLPTPWGLVRGGVAPDHPEKKLIDRTFERTACNPNFHFFGNVEVGRDISLAELRDLYDGVILAYGAAGHKKADLAGEDTPGCIYATDFVGWYSGHPDFSGMNLELQGERAVIVGNGNVALDIARILTLPVEELRRTDIASHALKALERSNVRTVTVLGRRGALQAAFNNPELAELGHLPEVDVVVDRDDLPTDDEIDLTAPDWAARRKLETLRSYAARVRQHARSIELRFLALPRSISPEEGRLVLDVERNSARPDLAKGKFLPTGDVRQIHCDHLFFSVGFEGRPLSGAPFDQDRCIIPNDRGRIAAGLYACGWIARGPSGVIGMNKLCAERAVQALLEDLDADILETSKRRPREYVAQLIKDRSVRSINFRQWQGIDEMECENGALEGRRRQKLVDWDSLLASVPAG